MHKTQGKKTIKKLCLEVIENQNEIQSFNKLETYNTWQIIKSFYNTCLILFEIFVDRSLLNCLCVKYFTY